MTYTAKCPECGAEFSYTASGDYYPQTWEEPASYPEIEIVKRTCDDDCIAIEGNLIDQAMTDTIQEGA